MTDNMEVDALQSYTESDDKTQVQSRIKELEEHIAAIGKGKGKGTSSNKGCEKGQPQGQFNGECYNCGKWGHSVKFCRSPPTGGSN